MLKNNIKNYLLYALGEVALVMIGILLALQVNNWNEDRKQERELSTILNTVKLDLTRDTIVASGIIKFYEENEKQSLKIINKKFNRDSIIACLICKNLVTIYQPFSPQTKGLEMLKKYSNQNNLKNDTLAITITQFYGTLDQLLRDSNGFIKSEVLKNIESFQDKDWYVDWTQGKMTPELIDYYLSEDYRKRVAAHNIFGAKNHLLFVNSYKNGAKKIIELIDKKTSR
ncbi:MAG: hypothetical protein JXQ93_13055 [Flavobacteriaceae bacterium]